MEPPCECPCPGQCPRYGIHQGVYAYGICSGQGSPGYPCSPERSEMERAKWARKAEARKGADPSRSVRPPQGVRDLPVVSRPRTPNPYPYQSLPSATATTSPPPPLPERTVAAGPGTELKLLLASLGLHPGGCKCGDRMRAMDAWGVEGCRVRREEIVGWLREEAGKRHWWEKFAAGLHAVRKGLILHVSNPDPISSLLDLALSRATQNITNTFPNNVIPPANPLMGGNGSHGPSRSS